MRVVLHALPYLLAAAGTTLWVSLLGMALGQMLGAAVCLLRRSGLRGMDRAGAAYVSFFRGVPLLVQLLLIYLFLPRIDLNVPPLAAAVIALGLASGAYVSEIFRGALAAIPPGQAEAADALGMTRRGIWRRVLLPQMLRLSLPAEINELILLLKASSLISAIGVTELTRTAQSYAAATYRPLQMYVTAALIYLLMNLALAGLGQLAERRLAAG